VTHIGQGQRFVVAPVRSRSIDSDNRVVRFRPRPRLSHERQRGLPQSWHSEPDDSPVADLQKYEGVENRDDHRHRMIVNAIVLAFAIGMVVAGVWLADVISRIR
jgi:hypothetical protein